MMAFHVEMMVFHIEMMMFHRTLQMVAVQAADCVQLPEPPVCWAVQAADLTQRPEPGTGGNDGNGAEMPMNTFQYPGPKGCTGR